jgi:hypothetical protein
MRKQYAVAIAAALALLAQPGIAAAQSSYAASANAIMPGCRNFIAENNRDLHLLGDCVGTVSTMFYFGETHFEICAPNGATVGQAVRVVTLYIDRRPERMHENFKAIALEALQQAWPCRR